MLQVRSEVFGAVGRPAGSEERPRLWSLMVGVFPKYVAYQRRAGRELPVVVLEPSA